jgi:hypothetical protein
MPRLLQGADALVEGRLGKILAERLQRYRRTLRRHLIEETVHLRDPEVEHHIEKRVISR